MVQASDQDVSGTPPLKGVPATSIWTKAQNSLEELYILSGHEATWSWKALPVSIAGLAGCAGTPR